MEIFKETTFKKIQSLVGDHSFTVVLPKDFANDLGITKGDFVKVLCCDKRIIIEKYE